MPVHLQENGASVVDTAVMEQASDKATSSSQDSMTATDSATSSGSGFDLVAASEWPDLPAEVVLLSPSQCRTLWRQFSSDSTYAVQQVAPAYYAVLHVHPCICCHGALKHSSACMHACMLCIMHCVHTSIMLRKEAVQSWCASCIEGKLWHIQQRHQHGKAGLSCIACIAAAA